MDHRIKTFVAFVVGPGKSETSSSNRKKGGGTLDKRTRSKLNFIAFFWTKSRKWSVVGGVSPHMCETYSRFDLFWEIQMLFRLKEEIYFLALKENPSFSSYYGSPIVKSVKDLVERNSYQILCWTMNMNRFLITEGRIISRSIYRWIHMITVACLAVKWIRSWTK